jgi:adenylyltransferase/sulfurtransferase
MVRAGVGLVRILDDDIVNKHDLHRQVLFTNKHVGMYKSAVANIELRKCCDLGTDVQFAITRLEDKNAWRYIEGMTLVLDGTDNWKTRVLLDETCAKLGVPWIYGGVTDQSGIVMPIMPGERLPEMRPDAPNSSGAVVAPIVHIVAGIQCLMALRILTGESPTWKFVNLNAKNGWFMAGRMQDTAESHNQTPQS